MSVIFSQPSIDEDCRRRVLVYSIVSLFNCIVVFSPALHDIHCILLLVLRIVDVGSPAPTFWSFVFGHDNCKPMQCSSKGIK